MGQYIQKDFNQNQAIISFLRRYADKPRDSYTIQTILTDLGIYYHARCVYVFELNARRTHVSQTYEWCFEGVSETLSSLQNIPVEDMQLWFDLLQDRKELMISIYGQDKKGYQLLKIYEADSMLLSPIILNDEMIGFIVVENPECHNHDLLLLSVVSSSYLSQILKDRLAHFTHDQSMELSIDRMKIIQSLSEIYTSVYYIDLIKDHYIELSSISTVHSYIGSSGKAQGQLYYFCEHMIVPEFRDEMFEFVDLSTLEERLNKQHMISKQYISTVLKDSHQKDKYSWSQCSFVEVNRDQQGRLTHVIFTTQSIQDSKVKELEAQRKLQETNKELTALLEAEKQHTAIIGSLGSVFFALYYIDLENNTLQEIISLDQFRLIYGEKGDARDSLKRMTDVLVAKDFIPLMRVFTDFDTIDTRLANQSMIIQEFMTPHGEWNRCSLIPVERDENGRNKTIICGLRQITAEKETLVTQDNLILALSMSYENVYAVNMDTCEAICYRMGQVMSDRYGERFYTGHYEKNICYYIENDVLKEDRYLFDKIRNVSDVKELLSENNTYYFNYRVYRNQSIQYFQCQLVKPHQNRNEFIVGFKNVDEEKKQELEQQRKVEEALMKVEKMNATLQEEMAVSEALSKEYHSLFKINVEDGSLSLYRSDGLGMSPQLVNKLMAVRDYEKIMSLYIDTYVVAEDRERLKELTKLDVLIERVPDVGLYKLGYRRIMDGVISYYEMNVVKTADKNHTISFILGLRDIDEEMRRQLKLTHEMETQREIIEGLGSEYYSVLLVDPYHDKVTTYRAEDEDGRDISEHFYHYDHCWSKGLQSYALNMVSDSSRDEFIQKLSLDYISEEKDDYSLTYEKMTNNGIMYLQARVSFVHEKDGRHAVVVGTRNVDDLIKKERQQEAALKAAYDAAEAANKAKTSFLSNMSHDIRTPMNGIIGMTAIAGAHIDDKERVQDSLLKINQASKHLLSLINEVLDMSKIESGKVQLIEEEFNLSDLVDNLLNMMSSQIEEHHHQLSVNISGVIHEAVVGDSLRIQKVFTNLMGNAVKFTPDGGKIQITISEKPCQQAKLGCYEFIFEDNGMGMSQDFIEKIFEPFSRAEETKVKNIQGTGLGMPISRNIVRMMGGDIKVESQLDVGSRFIVTMYLKLQDVLDNHYDKFVDLDILVVDDDEMSLETCCYMLNDLGMKAEGVSSGKEAVERVVYKHEINQDYFACIIDWKMPDMDGIQTTKAIRQAVGNDVPIIIFSAYDWADIEQEARAAGANAFITKPLFRSRLAKTFDILLGEDENQVETVALDDMKKIDLKGHRALLVEDNELNAEIAIEILKMTGLEIERACDGTEAVDKMTECQDGYYDIIFMDIQMPKMNGYDATRAIRAMKRNYCKQIPIIAMTANAFAEDVIAAKTVGMNEHIAKPFDLKIIIKTLKKWL